MFEADKIAEARYIGNHACNGGRTEERQDNNNCRLQIIRLYISYKVPIPKQFAYDEEMNQIDPKRKIGKIGKERYHGRFFLLFGQP